MAHEGHTPMMEFPTQPPLPPNVNSTTFLFAMNTHRMSSRRCCSPPQASLCTQVRSSRSRPLLASSPATQAAKERVAVAAGALRGSATPEKKHNFVKGFERFDLERFNDNTFVDVIVTSSPQTICTLYDDASVISDFFPPCTKSSQALF